MEIEWNVVIKVVCKSIYIVVFGNNAKTTE